MIIDAICKVLRVNLAVGIYNLLKAVILQLCHLSVYIWLVMLFCKLQCNTQYSDTAAKYFALRLHLNELHCIALKDIAVDQIVCLYRSKEAPYGVIKLMRSG